MIKDLRDMNEHELTIAAETASIIRNALDKSNSLEELRVSISDLMNEYMRHSFKSEIYFSHLKNYSREELKYLLLEGQQINEILVGEINYLNQSIERGEHNYDYQ